MEGEAAASASYILAPYLCVYNEELAPDTPPLPESKPPYPHPQVAKLLSSGNNTRGGVNSGVSREQVLNEIDSLPIRNHLLSVWTLLPSGFCASNSSYYDG